MRPKLLLLLALIASVVAPTRADAQLVAASPPSAPSGGVELRRPESVDEYGRKIDEAESATTTLRGTERDQAAARLRLLREWRAEDVSMTSPGALGFGIGFATIGTASTVVGLAFYLRGVNQTDTFGDWKTIGAAVLIPSALVLGGAAALIVYGVRPEMRPTTSSRSSAPYQLSLSPLGGISGVF